MASPTPPPVETPSPEGTGVLEFLGAQIASLAAQVTEIDQRMTSVESGSPSRPVEVHLTPETVAQIAEALAVLQAAGSQALDDVFKSATDDLTEALSGLVRAEISRSLSDAGYSVDVIEVAEPDVATDLVEEPDVATDLVAEPDVATDLVEADEDDQAEEDLTGHDLREVEPVAASVRSGPEPAAMPSIVASLAASSTGVAGRTEAAYESIREASSGFGDDDDDDVDDDDVDDDDEDLVVDADRAPHSLAELDDPFLDALIRKEPLSA